jgi:two-component system alkaline phosphatase synthesis response regulator PhoP
VEKTKILVVEDEPSVSGMYKFKLEQAGYEVKIAENGEQGLSLAEEFLPNLILLDLKMPVLSGDEMLKILRSREWGASIRVVVLTNISKSEAPSILRFLGVDRYIVKVHTVPEEVVKIVKDVLAG